ncbi:MAG: cytidine deaminase [Candidatus Eisenbacteria bacterium]|uniref:Cytidine deaminase n=1 Tax=Eiseniibacteriota bacterium TaxID=2212470 RepID=A0A956M0Z3_UNCEI|nr:cytidine deaminase [Candidatus Eisenbacteria bacterium]
MSIPWSALTRAARDAARRAHAPYSGFHVGAALVDRTGRVFVGANLENVAYPLGVCAERVALADWRARGGAPLIGVVVFTATDRPTPPCGLCRDALLRFAPGAQICLATQRARTGPWTASDFVPSPEVHS